MNTSNSVRDLIIERIEKNIYEPGKRIDTFRKLAEETGTSTPTVSRALNQLVQDGYLRSEPNRGFYVRMIPGGGSIRGMTGLLLGVQQDAEMSREFAGKRYRDILPILQEGSIRLSRPMLTLGGFVGGENVPPDMIADHRFEALLVLGVYDNRYLAELSSVQSSVIVLDLDAVDIGVDSVSFDHIGSTVAMVQHLVNLGKRRIAFVGGPVTPQKPACFQRGYDSCARERYDGYLAGLRACGICPHSNFIKITPARDEEATLRALHELTAAEELPDAILAEAPKETILHLKEAGLADKISVSGWTPEDIYASQGASMACASLGDFEPLGIAAMEVLQNRLENPHGPVQRRKIFSKVMGPDGSVLVDK